MSKVDPNYELTVGLGNQAVIIRPPFSIIFGIDKSDGLGVNKAEIKIKGLKESTRLKMIKDQEQQKYFPVSLSVGWGEKLSVIFKGDVQTGSNDRQGPEFITSIMALDGGHDYLNSYTSRTINAEENPVAAIVGDMPNTTIGKLTQATKLFRPKVLVGSSSQLIENSLAPDERFFINDEQVFILKESEVIGSYIPVVSAQTGLINTPQRKSQRVTFDVLMSPEITLGGRFKLVSTVAPHLNGEYKCVAITYTGEYKNTGATEWKMNVTGFKSDDFEVIR